MNADTPFNPPAALAEAIFADLTTGRATISDLAARLNLRLSQLSAWLNAPAVAAQLLSVQTAHASAQHHAASTALCTGLTRICRRALHPELEPPDPKDPTGAKRDLMLVGLLYRICRFDPVNQNVPRLCGSSAQPCKPQPSSPPPPPRGSESPRSSLPSQLSKPTREPDLPRFPADIQALINQVRGHLPPSIQSPAAAAPAQPASSIAPVTTPRAPVQAGCRNHALSDTTQSIAAPAAGFTRESLAHSQAKKPQPVEQAPRSVAAALAPPLRSPPATSANPTHARATRSHHHLRNARAARPVSTAPS